MKRVIFTIACAVLALNSTNAQTFTKKYSDESDHAHYAIENLDEDIFMGGTTFEPGSTTSTDVHAQRLDVNGSIIWEQKFSIGSEERCLDIALVQDELLVLTGTTIISGNNRIFVMSLEQSTGALVDYQILNPGPAGHVSQTPTEIIYSESQGQLYLAGYSYDRSTAPMIIDEGILFSLNTSLVINWTRETPGTISTIEEIDGVGLYVSAFTHAAVDYSGNLLWQLNTGYASIDQVIDAEYDVANDRILALQLDALIEIINVSSSGTLNQIVTYYETSPDYRNIQHIDVELNPSTGELLLLQVSEEYFPTYRNYHPCIINLDPNTLAVNHSTVTLTHNPGAFNFDAWTEYNYGRGMSLSEWGDNFGVLFYEHPNYDLGQPNTHDLKILKTDNLGYTGLSCEIELPIYTIAPATSAQSPTSFTAISYSNTTPSVPDVTSNHAEYENCFEFAECAIDVTDILVDYIDCYEQDFSISYTANPGTVITNYAWNWGDGSTDNTTSPNISHAFSNANCFYTVCVTVTAIGTDGSTCTDTHCETVLMVNGDGCEPCGEGYGEGRSNTNGTGFAESTKLNVSPNPTSSNFTVELIGEELNGQFILLNAMGQTVFTSENIEGNYFTTTVDGTTLENGVYLLQFRDGTNVITKRIVKM